MSDVTLTTCCKCEVKGGQRSAVQRKKHECQHVCVDIFQTSRNLYPSIHLPTPAGLLFKDKHHQPCVCACWMAANPRARKTAHGDSGTPLWRLNDLRAAKKAKAKWATPNFLTNATIPGGFWCVLQKAPRGGLIYRFASKNPCCTFEGTSNIPLYPNKHQHMMFVNTPQLETARSPHHLLVVASSNAHFVHLTLCERNVNRELLRKCFKTCFSSQNIQ